MTQTIAIISAMPEEVEPLRQQLGIGEPEQVGGLELSMTEWNGLQVITAVSGIGKAQAGACMQYLITRHHPTEVVNIGAAGALSDQLRIGDLVLVEESIYHDVDCTGVGQPPHTFPGVPRVIPSDPALVRTLSHVAANLGIPCHSGRVATGDAFVSDKEQRLSIRRETEAVLVEMETAAFAQIAHLNGVPFVSVRSVSDNADGGAEVSFQTFLTEVSKRNATLLEAYLRAKAEQESSRH
ncbi:5'-methylthioadenosine/adenosylhomocysteine nucleosidase [Kroppenstedtia eburnea]|uniref:5'-methylthioadenosine/adenosylhomocysteine nucleosidase n=1 Tax=Kroppenstedtia eburnea TaxID=714067 RepID=UPI0036379F2D